MSYNPKIHHRRSIRLQWYDYSKAGFYFITLVCYNRKSFFGKIVSDSNQHNYMKLSSTGFTARSCWLEIPLHYPNVKLHEFIIMPDHLHGILEIKEKDDVFYGECRVKQINKFQKIIPGSIGSILRGYKIGVTKWLRDKCLMEDWFMIEREEIVLWQRNYYEHIIRNEQEYFALSKYIKNNPKNWKGVIEYIKDLEI